MTIVRLITLKSSNFFLIEKIIFPAGEPLYPHSWRGFAIRAITESNTISPVTAGANLSLHAFLRMAHRLQIGVSDGIMALKASNMNNPLRSAG